MSIRWILLCSAKPQVLEELDAGFVAHLNGAIS